MNQRRSSWFSILAVAALIAFAGGCQSFRDKAGALHTTPQERFARSIEGPLLRLDDKGALLAARVIDLETGQEWYSRNPDTAVIPASNGKLAISAAALDLFGPGHTFKTYLYREGNDLWIIGTGDPGTGDPKLAAARGRTPTTLFDEWADALLRKGIRKIPGKLIYWDAAFDRERVHPNWNRDFLVDWYAAPVSGLNFNNNCIDVTAFPTEPGQPARLQIVAPSPAVKVINQTVTGGEGEAVIEREPGAAVFTVKGGITKETKFESKPVTDPALFFAESFRTHIAQRGIVIEGETARSDTVPFGATGPIFERLVATHETPISDVLNRINKNSQNLFAEAISKSMGREFMFRNGQAEPGSWARGEEAGRQFLWRNRINAGSFVAADGSGLARENRVTARLITDLLVLMHTHPAGRTWRDSLAVAGVDGTISKRMTDIEGRVMAKTGYISGVRSLSGYVQNRNGKWFAFCFIYNNIRGSVKPYEELQDDACRVIYYWPGRPPARPAEPATQPTTTQPATTQPASQPADLIVIPATLPTTGPA